MELGRGTYKKARQGQIITRNGGGTRIYVFLKQNTTIQDT